MKILMILGLTTVLANAGCSTNQNMLEPGVDKYASFHPTLKDQHAGCCTNPDCPCSRDHVDAACLPCRPVQP